MPGGVDVQAVAVAADGGSSSRGVAAAAAGRRQDKGAAVLHDAVPLAAVGLNPVESGTQRDTYIETQKAFTCEV